MREWADSVIGIGVDVMMATVGVHTEVSDSPPSTLVGGPCVHVWPPVSGMSCRPSVLRGSGISCTLFLRNMTVLSFSPLLRGMAYRAEKTSKKPQELGAFWQGAGTKCSDDNRKRPDSNVSILPPIQPPQHSGSSDSGDAPSSQTGLCPESSLASSHRSLALG